MEGDRNGVQPQARHLELGAVERQTFTTMDEQLRLLADAVERMLSELFTVRELVILSPYARERSPAGQALATPATDARHTSRHGTSTDDSTRIRWGSIHEFKGLEAPAVILTDVDLSKEHHRDLLYVGASRATGWLVCLARDSAMALSRVSIPGTRVRCVRRSAIRQSTLSIP